MTVTLDRRHGIDPMTMVRHAVVAERADERVARRGRGMAYDAVWCVFDVDEHQQLAEALELARTNGIRVVLSNPCIELWFLLHFDGQRGHIDRHAAQRRADQHLGAGKGLSDEAFERLVDRHGTAAERAQRLDVMHEGNGAPYPGNPRSDLWVLVDRMRDAPAGG